jgi:pilus assembly protein CpaE
MTTIVESRAESAESYVSAIGSGVEVVPALDALKRHLDSRPNEYAVVLGPNVHLEAAVGLAESLRLSRPALSVILLRHRIDTPVLTEALRSGMREVVEDRDLTGLGQAVRRAYTLHQALAGDGAVGGGRRAGQLVTVFSAKGGVGKTTVSTNLAVLLADGGRNSVCLVDLDLAFGDVAVSLQILPARTIADAVPMGEDLDPASLESLLTPYREGLTTLVAPLQPDAKDAISAELVGRILAMLRQQYDYVVVDTAPAFDDHVLMAFDHSDLLLLVLTLDVPALKATKITLETLDLLNYPRERVRLVLNRADTKVGLSVAEVEKALQFDVSATVPSAREVPASINRGEPVCTAHPRHPVTQSLRALAASCAEAATEAAGADAAASAPAPHPRSRGRFARKSYAR